MNYNRSIACLCQLGPVRLFGRAAYAVRLFFICVLGRRPGGIPRPALLKILIKPQTHPGSCHHVLRPTSYVRLATAALLYLCVPTGSRDQAPAPRHGAATAILAVPVASAQWLASGQCSVALYHA